MKIAISALCVCLTLSVLMLVNPPSQASAQQVLNDVCVTGTYVAGQCEVRTDVAPDCQPDTCLVEVIRPSVPRTEPATRAEPDGCPTGALGLVDQCFIYVAKGVDGCSRGSYERLDGHCAQPVANRAGPYSCSDGARLSIIARNQTCIFDTDPVFGFCPAGSEAFNGQCADFAVEGLSANCGLLSEDFASARCIEPSNLNPDGAQVCAPSTSFVQQACVTAVDGLVVEPCAYPVVAFDVLTGDRCLVSVEPLIARCDAAFSRDSAFEQNPRFENCIRFVPKDEVPDGTPICASGSLTDDESRCFVYASFDPSALKSCSGGVVSTNGTVCLSVEDATAGPLNCPPGARGSVGNCYFDVTPITCSAGQLLGPLCLVPSGDEPVRADPSCAVSSTVFLDGDFCYYIVTRASSGVCPLSSIEQDGECRREVELRPGPFVCEDSTQFFVDSQCFTQVPAEVPDGTCPVGAVVVASTGQCRQPVNAVPAFYFCADDNATLFGTVCAIRSGSPTTPVCPSGFAINPAGQICFRFEEAVAIGSAVCPSGALGTVGNCYIDVTPRVCSQGRQANDGCLIITDPPIATEGECRVSSTVFLDGDFCYSIVARDNAGNCPSFAVEQNGECRRPVAIAPGPRVCQQPSHYLLSGQCFVVVPADVPTGPCPLGSLLVAGICRQPVNDSVASYTCADPTAELVGITTCAIQTDFIANPSQSLYTCDEGERTIEGVGPGSVICIVGTPTTTSGSTCPDGGATGFRVCIFSEPFTEVACPDNFATIAEGLLCQGELPPNNTYRCATFGDFVTFDAAGSPGCARPTGPQPGACPGVTRAGQCYKFVDHTLACAPGGCLASVPAQPAAPATERGDVDCNTRVDIRDALMIARTVADASIDRETQCTNVGSINSVRIVAADLRQDGTVDALDARRLLQCLVDDTVASCSG